MQNTQWPMVSVPVRLWIEQFRLEPRPGSLLSTLGQNTLLSQCLSPCRCINGYQGI